MRLYLAVFLGSIFLAVTPVSAAETVLTERDWMVQLTEALGWSFGLPDEPQTDDYRRILEGRRRYRIEAEDCYHPDDNVSVQQFQTFGAFSGRGWLSGIATPSRARLRYDFPLAGDFSITAALRLPGHQVRIGDQSFTVDGGPSFAPHPLGTLLLPAGAQEIVLALPPNSSVDYLDFVADDLPPVQPRAGWQPQQLLTLAVMAETIAQVLDLHGLLPPAGAAITIEAEGVKTFPVGAENTNARHLGEPSGGEWVRAGAVPASLDFHFLAPHAGFYQLASRAAAEAPVTVTVNEHLTTRARFHPYLDTLPLGAFFLPEGSNILRFDLPPRAGVDFLRLHPLSRSGEDLLRLTGLAGESDPPSPELAEKVLSLLAAIGGTR